MLKFFLIYCFIFFTSCKNKCENIQQETKTMMKSWYKKKIFFPSNMEKLINVSSTNNKISDLINMQGYTIVHFFTADCDKCIDELSTIKKSLQNLPENPNVNFVFIASAPTKLYVSDAIKKINFPYPIYYEREYYSFKTINKLPVSDNLYNTMILNNNSEVILFGAFYDNDKAKSLYSKILICNL